MKKTNSTQARLFLALKPNEIEEANQEWTEVRDLTAFTMTPANKVHDATYFHDGGETTSLIVGRKTTISCSCDYDNENPVHVYIRNLSYGKIGTSNSQLMKIECLLDTNENLVSVTKGTCTLDIKTLAPTGVADELIKLDFDIHPQDRAFTHTIEDRTPATTPEPESDTTEPTPTID